MFLSYFLSFTFAISLFFKTLSGINNTKETKLDDINGDYILSIRFNQLEEVRSGMLDFVAHALSLSPRWPHHLQCIRRTSDDIVTVTTKSIDSFEGLTLDEAFRKLHKLRESSRYYNFDDPFQKSDFKLIIKNYRNIDPLYSSKLTHLFLERLTQDDIIYPEPQWYGHLPSLEDITICDKRILYFPKWSAQNPKKLKTYEPELSYGGGKNLGSIELRQKWDLDVEEESKGWFEENDIDEAIEDAKRCLQYLSTPSHQQHAIFNDGENPWKMRNCVPYKVALTLPPNRANSKGSFAPAQPKLNALPVELREKIANYLPKTDALRLRESSRAFENIRMFQIKPKRSMRLQKGKNQKFKNNSDQTLDRRSTHTLICTNPKNLEESYAVREKITVHVQNGPNVGTLFLQWRRPGDQEAFLKSGPLYVTSPEDTPYMPVILDQNTHDLYKASDILRKLSLTHLARETNESVQKHIGLFRDWKTR